MADFAAALRQRLLDDGAISALIGEKVHWSSVPATSAAPYLRLQAQGGAVAGHLAGSSGVARAVVTFDAFAAKHKDAWAVAEAARAAIAGGATVAEVRFVSSDAELPRDLGEDIPGVGFVHLVKFSAEIVFRAA